MNKTKQICKILGIIVFAVLIICLILKMFPIFKSIFTLEGRIKFQNEIRSLGIKGCFVIIALMIIQTFLLFLPIEVVELLAGMCYGTLGGTILIYVGVILTITIVYFLVKLFGKEVIYFFVSREKIEKIENSEFWKNSKKIDIALFIAYFIPGTPKGLLTYIGALFPIKFEKFLLIIMLARFPEIISSTIVGNNILYGNWLIVFFVYLITFLISVIIYYIYTKITDKKELKNLT